MQVICLQDQAFYALIDEVVTRMRQTEKTSYDKWISPEEGMEKLRIKSKTTLQKLRAEGRIRFSQPEKRLILYDVESINDFLSKHSHETF